MKIILSKKKNNVKEIVHGIHWSLLVGLYYFYAGLMQKSYLYMEKRVWMLCHCSLQTSLRDALWRIFPWIW